jgi:GT2 family glycosyltransferase
MTASPVTVSICVANFNGVGVIETCLDSVLAQQCDANIELLVHDDASTDDSLAVLESAYPQAILLRSEDNVGFCVANNRMAASASGDYLLLLNNDAWLAPDAIAALLAGSLRYPGAVLSLPQYDAATRQLVDCGMFQDLFANAIMQETVREGPVAMVMGACLWLSRDLWHRCGGLPEWFGSMAEDMYLCNYARLLGHPVIALEQGRYYHHVGYSFGGGKVLEDGLATTIRRRQLSERNKTWVMALFYPAPVVYLLLPLHLLLLLVEGLLLSLVKWDGAIFSRIYWHAIRAFFGRLGLLRRERSAIQRQRVISVTEFFSVYRLLPHKLRMLLRYGLPSLR